MVLSIKNVGHLPAEEITVSLQPSSDYANWLTQLKVRPPLPYKSEHQGDAFFLTFTRKLGPGNEVTVSFPATPPSPSALVASEVGLASLISEPVQQEVSKKGEPPGDEP